MAELVGEEGGTVVGVEHIPELQALSVANMSRSVEGKAFLASGRVKFQVGDGRKGWVDKEEDEGKEDKDKGQGKGWDVIHVGASAVTIHQDLVDQLRSPGRMFIPVDDEQVGDDYWDGLRRGQHIWTVDKDEEGNVTKTKLFAVKYVPLTDGPTSQG